MDKKLENIRKAYDLTVEQYRRGIDPYKDIPEKIKNTDFFKSFAAKSEALGSGAQHIQAYLNPAPGMKFLDAGCSANLANYRLDRWLSTYYGVDISSELIKAMKNFVNTSKISIGGLYVADISRLPFSDNFFDIAAVIGVFEYSKTGYIKEALREFNRVLKSNARVVLDIPNENHPCVKDMAALEKHLGRPIFIRPRAKFEGLFTPLFNIERVDDSSEMLKYFARAKKKE